MPSLAGAVLIGGHSRRMGRHKAAIDLGDGPLADVLASRLADAGCAPVWLIGADRGVDSQASRIDDRWPDVGPVGGVATAVVEAVAAGVDGVVVVACDLPDLDSDTMSSLADAFAEAPGRPVVGRSPRGREPLISLWPVGCVETIAAAAETGGAVKTLLDRLDPSEVAISPSAARNVNRPGDLWPTGHPSESQS